MRPLQGMTELPFPVFAATWYEEKAFGYYNYFGRGVEGGGMSVWGGMCGVKFDGENCSTDINLNPPKPSESSTSGIYSGGS